MRVGYCRHYSGSLGSDVPSGSVRRAGGSADEEVSDMAFANLSNRDYLLCGFSGNRAGTSWHIDNFAIMKAAP